MARILAYVSEFRRRYSSCVRIKTINKKNIRTLRVSAEAYVMCIRNK